MVRLDTQANVVRV